MRIIVPYAPGGQADVAVRILARHLALQFGQPFVVENMPGSNGFSAITALLRAPADGYTLAYGDAGHWAINPALNPQTPYDPERDFTPIGAYGETAGIVVVAGSALPVRSLQDLFAYARANPGKLSYASPGVGSVHHIVMEDLKSRLRLDIVHIPYKSSAQAVPAVVGGQVPLGVASLANVAGFAQEGRLRVLGISTRKRSPMAPTVPPIAEAGVPGFDHDAEVGLIARAGVPQPIVDVLARTLAGIVANPEVVAGFAKAGLEPVSDTSPGHLAERMRSDRRKYADLVRSIGIGVE